jgi:hypothetical protein
VEVPRGALGHYVEPVTKNPDENEWILMPGTRYRVLRVEQKGNQYIVRVRVESQPGLVYKDGEMVKE